MSARGPVTRRSRRTRARLVQAARDQLAHAGQLDAEVVALEAGVSTATFYAHFDRHDDAVAAALDLSLTAIVGVAELHFHIEALLEEGVDRVLPRLIREAHAVFREESSVLRAALARTMLHDRIREVYVGHEKRSLEYLARQISLGQKAGVLRDGPPELRATSMLIVLQSLQNPLLKHQGLDPGVAEDMERALRAVLISHP